MSHTKTSALYLLFLALFGLAAWAILAHGGTGRPPLRNEAGTSGAESRAVGESASAPIPAAASTPSPSGRQAGYAAGLVDTFKRPFPILLC